MARGQALRLGPFVGGMNTASDATTVADSELVDAVNFDLDIDGSLVGRPPIVETTGTGNDTLIVIGRATLAGVSYVIVAENDGGVYAYDGSSFTTISATLKSKVALQYRNNVYIIPAPGTKATQNGGRWDGTTFTADANMPEGEAAVFHKTRMFVVPGASASTNTSRVEYTDVISADAFTWGSFTDISPGDGENLIDVVVYNDNLLLFKQDSTYVLAYDLQPTDAIVRDISSTIGATAYRCVVQYENSVFTYHEGRVYEIVNYDFARVSIKVPFTYDAFVPATFTRRLQIFMCLLGDRLIVRYHNRIYVYGLKTRTWTRWSSEQAHLHNFGPLMAFPSNSSEDLPVYYGGSSLDLGKMFKIQNGYDSASTESTITGGTINIICTLQTKNYDLADSHHFKKLMWWGADVYTNQDMVGVAAPIISSYRTTWGDVAALTWASVAGNTWNQPTIAPTTEQTNVSDSSAVLRKFVKFYKTLRFRQMYFTLQLAYDGSTVSGPCRLFTLTAIMASKQTVGKQVN